MTLRADAGRYECGTLNTIGCFGLQAALELILEVSPGCIGPLVAARANEIAAGAVAKGYEILGDRRPENASGIVCIRHPSIDSRVVVHQLKEKGISATPRQGWVRCSPHFYISPADIAKVVEALP